MATVSYQITSTAAKTLNAAVGDTLQITGSQKSGSTSTYYGLEGSVSVPGCSYTSYVSSAKLYNLSGTLTAGGTYTIPICTGMTNGTFAVTPNSITLTVIGSNNTVTFNANGGSSTSSAQTVTSGSAITLPSASRTGYTFNGWYTAASGGTKVGNAGASYTVTANITLYAQWTLNTYTVTYNANGGTVSPTSANATYGNSVTLPTPTQDGFEFNGWYTAASGGTKVGNAGVAYAPSSNITLYAQWTASGTYVFSAKYDKISADQILDNIGKTITTVQNKLHEYISSLGGVTYTNSSGVFSYTIAAEDSIEIVRTAASKAANHTGNSITYMDWSVVTTAPAQTYSSYHSLNNIVTSLNALKTHYSSMKGQKVTQVSMAALFMALSSLLSSLVYHRVRFLDKPVLRSNTNTTAVAGGSVDPTVSVANVTGWAANISAIAHATAEQANEVLDSAANVSTSFTSSSCSSSSSSSCCSSSSSSSCSSSSCSCWFIAFYDVGGI